MTPADEAAVTAQLGRPPAASPASRTAARAASPAVVATEPRLPDGTPFPTTYYLTCPRAVAACSRLEASGVMAEMTDRLADDPELADGLRGRRTRPTCAARAAAGRGARDRRASAPAGCRTG